MKPQMCFRVIIMEDGLHQIYIFWALLGSFGLVESEYLGLLAYII